MVKMSTSRHEGVSCDACMKSNFTGDRFKCLRCFDFDLCRVCFEQKKYGGGNEHSLDHPMQMVMTKDDYDLAYWGESQSWGGEEMRIQVFTCPHCNQMGLTINDLYEHASAEHADVGYEVICPVCVATPSADPNRMTDDLSGHMAAEHLLRQDRTHEESRLLHRRYQTGGRGRGRQRAYENRSVGGGSSFGGRRTSGGTAAAAGTPDSIAELLNQLGGSRRYETNGSYATTLAQIQQLQQQISRRAGGGGHRGAGGGERAGGAFYVALPSSADAYADSAALSTLWSELLADSGGSGGGSSLGAIVDASGQQFIVRSAGANKQRAVEKTKWPAPPAAAHHQQPASQALVHGAELLTADGFLANLKRQWRKVDDDPRLLASRKPVENKLTEDEEKKEAEVQQERADEFKELFLATMFSPDDE